MSTANLDHLAALVAERDNLAAEIKRLTEAQKALDAHIQHEMGEAEAATIGGRPAFTWKRTGQFSEKRFRTEQPAAADRYTVLVPAIDTDKLAAESPELYAAYRARRFERKA
jgi:predicted phage-related endonuclease